MALLDALQLGSFLSAGVELWGCRGSLGLRALCQGEKLEGEGRGSPCEPGQQQRWLQTGVQGVLLLLQHGSGTTGAGEKLCALLQVPEHCLHACAGLSWLTQALPGQAEEPGCSAQGPALVESSHPAAPLRWAGSVLALRPADPSHPPSW